MARVVRVRVVEDVAVVTLDAPPVNALTAPLRAGLWEAVERVDALPQVKAAVLMATGKMFSAGADVRTLDGTGAPPSLAQLCDRIEASDTPIVAVIQGPALGGGAELALAAHYRVGVAGAHIGLPEVALGLVPSAGGTQRLPRLIGAEAALHMMVTTASVEVKAGLRMGLIDALIKDDETDETATSADVTSANVTSVNVSSASVTGGAIDFAKGVLAKGAPVRRTRDLRDRMADGRAFQQAVTKARLALVGNPQHAPHRVVDCVEAAALLPFEAGQAFEADAFARCLAHPQSVALRHMFTAERRTDTALLDASEAGFKPAEPMGKSAVLRLRKAMRAAADVLVANGVSEAAVDEAMVRYGFRKGPFGGKEAAEDGAEDAADIARRVVAALLVEGAACVDEGAVQRPADIDVLAVHGLGFPRRKGGPFRAAQSAGLLHLRNEMREWADDSAVWAVPALLETAVLDAAGFDTLNRI